MPAAPQTTPPTAEQLERMTRIIVGFFMTGVLGFSGFVVADRLLGLGIAPPPAGAATERTLLIALGAMAAAMTVATFVVRAAMVGGLRRRTDAGEAVDDRTVLGAWSMSTIVRASMVESVGLLGAAIVFITGNWLGLAGVAFAVAGLLAVFPTRGKRESFARDATGRMPSL